VLRHARQARREGHLSEWVVTPFNQFRQVQRSDANRLPGRGCPVGDCDHRDESRVYAASGAPFAVVGTEELLAAAGMASLHLEGEWGVALRVALTDLPERAILHTDELIVGELQHDDDDKQHDGRHYDKHYEVVVFGLCAR